MKVNVTCVSESRTNAAPVNPVLPAFTVKFPTPTPPANTDVVVTTTDGFTAPLAIDEPDAITGAGIARARTTTIPEPPSPPLVTT